MPARQRRWIVRLAVATCAVVLASDLALSWFVLRDGTIGWRPIPPFTAVTHATQREWLAGQHAELEGRQRPGVMGQFDPELGWCNVAARSTAPNALLSYSYNARGARAEREYADQPPAGVTRLACFGESFTHCDEVGNRGTWTYQLEALEPRVEALNFGVGGYGTDQALLRFRREGLHGAQVLCIGFMLENMGRNVNRYRPMWYPTSTSCGAKPRFALNGGALELVPLPYATRQALVEAIESGRVLADLADHEYWNAETRLQWLRFSAFLRLGAGWWAYHRRDVAGLYDEPRSEPYLTSLALLEQFAREARELGAAHAPVLIFPREGDLKDLALDGERYWADFAAELERRGVAVIDTTAELARAWLAARADPELPRIYAGGHLSNAGNAIVARELRAWLAAQALAAER